MCVTMTYNLTVQLPYPQKSYKNHFCEVDNNILLYLQAKGFGEVKLNKKEYLAAKYMWYIFYKIKEINELLAQQYQDTFKQYTK